MTLPQGFESLSPFVTHWAIDSAAGRDAARGSASAAEAKAFYDSMQPLLEPALDLLDQMPLEQHDVAQKNLMLLALSFAHASFAVDVHGAVDEAKHRELRRHLRITHAPADV
jgi:hypothetical protein